MTCRGNDDTENDYAENDYTDRQTVIDGLLMDNDMGNSFTGYGIGPLGYKLKNPFRENSGMDFFI